MNFLKKLKERNVIDESLMPFIFGDNLENPDYWYEIDYDLPRLTRVVLLFYFGLTQAYCFANAQQNGKTLKEIDLSDKVMKPILRMWDTDSDDGFSSEGDIFSYFITSSECGDYNLFTQSTRELLIKIHKAYEPVTMENSRAMLNSISRNLFLDVLEALPLLKNTSFVEKTMKFEITTSDAKLSIKASPFVSFLSFKNNPIGEPVEKVTDDCYILCAVSKGETNNELFFDTVRLDKLDTDIDERRLCRRLKSNESLTLICKTANINTNWYSMDDCWCDLKFLNKMVDATENVLLNCCKITNIEFEKEIDIRERLLLVFADTDLYEAVAKYPIIRVKDLNSILFELFLTEGLFKTVRCIMYTPEDIDWSSDKIFELYLGALTDSGVIDGEAYKRYIEICERKISVTLDKLTHIVAKKSPTYLRRTLEIHAEWKTFYILQAAGIRSNNLFADVETILSIDDYYDMLDNDVSTVENDLIQLLETMCVFYSALLENTVPFDEEKYFSDVELIAPKYISAGHTLEQLFDAFIEISARSESLPHLEELLGRSGIGLNATRYLKFSKKDILSKINNPQTSRLSKGSTGYGIFVSYAHEDYDKVKPIIDRWRKMGLKFFFDESDIHHGQNWQKVAEDAMDRDECKLVVAFVSEKSVGKEAVAMEIEHAHLWRAKKYPSDPTKQSMFIIPINLEKEPIKDYLPKVANLHPNVDKERAYAKRIRKCIGDEDVFIDYHSSTESELDECIISDYETLSRNDGRVVAPEFYEGSFKLAVANFYAFLKYGSTLSKEASEIHNYFNDENADFSKCIFPIVTSVKETRIKRDNIAIVGYELIRGKGRKKSRLSHILTSKTLEIYDYYCIPKYRNSSELKDWMIEPLLIRCDRFIDILSKAKEKNNE